jgi:hypothetical protein
MLLATVVLLHSPPWGGRAILFSRFPLSISRVVESIKASSTLRIHAGRKESGVLWQLRFFDRAPESVKEYYEKVEYIRFNPMRTGLVKRGEDWRGRVRTTTLRLSARRSARAAFWPLILYFC